MSMDGQQVAASVEGWLLIDTVVNVVFSRLLVHLCHEMRLHSLVTWRAALPGSGKALQE